MSTLNYKLEYFKDPTEPSDEGVFIHIYPDIPPEYTTLVSRESYAAGGGTYTDLANQFFSIPGITRLALQSTRVYVEKSPIFSWNNILNAALTVIKGVTNTTTLNELPGSGITIESPSDRRGFE